MGMLCLAGVLQGISNPIWAKSIGNFSVNQQEVYTLKGNVVDKTGEPVIGANVVIKGTTTGVVTDFDGNFTIDVTTGTILTITYIGYNPMDITVNGQKTLTVTMSENAEALDELVVVDMELKQK